MEKTVYMTFYDSTKITKDKYGNSRMYYLLPRAIYRNPCFDHKIRKDHNKNRINEFKEAGYKVVVLCPSEEHKWNYLLSYYADEFIVY
jgi:hypothetical protein